MKSTKKLLIVLIIELPVTKIAFTPESSVKPEGQQKLVVI